MGSAGSVPAIYDEPARRITILFIALTSILTGLRAISRHLHGSKIGVDDILVYLAYVINLGLLITCLLMISNGVVSLPKLVKSNAEERTIQKHFTIAFGTFYTLAIITVKISLLFLYRRIFTIPPKWFKIGWWANFIALMPCLTVFTLTMFGIQATRNLELKKNTLGRVGNLISGSLNATSDFSILVLPVGILTKLMLPLREKAALLGIFSLGLIATSVSIMRTVRFQVKINHGWNPAYSFYNDMTLTIAETSVSVMCACLMHLKPVLRVSRDLLYSRTRGLLSLAQTGSVHSDDVRLASQNRANGGITVVYKYDVETMSSTTQSSQKPLQSDSSGIK